VIGVLSAGGKGVRLGADPTSKPMVDVGGRPLYTYGVEALMAVGSDEVTVLSGGNHDVCDNIIDGMKDGESPGLAPVSVVCGEPRGILADLASLAPFNQDVAMCFGDEWYDLEAVREFASAWERSRALGAAAMLFAVRDSSMVRKTYTVLGAPMNLISYHQAVRAHRFIEKPKFIWQERPAGPIAGTGLAIVRKEVANRAVDVADHPNWVDLFQLAVDEGLTVYVVPFDAPYFNVNEKEDLVDLRKYVTET